MGERFTGTPRYELGRRLGEGGMGVVYEARDRERDRTVALKTLGRVDPAAIYRLKQEFRSLADVVHPNLVALYDLVATGEDWFFTMELVPGRSFVDFVRAEAAPVPDPAPLRPEPTGLLTLASPGSLGPPDVTAAAEGPAPQVRFGRGGVPDLARLRAATNQLTEAVQAIHSAGKLHRDLKPNNVLVTETGRVVVLDFGLVQDRDGGDGELTRDEIHVAGTPAYMAPEQAAGERATPASDWYAVGAMLYEALVGRLPFTGTVRTVLAQKQLVDPPAPASIVAEVPPDLDRLCRALLHRDPCLRPGFGDIVARLRLGTVLVVPSRARAASPPPSDRGAPFVGRTRELATLADALADTRHGHPLLVTVHGPPGAGKSALLARFAERLRRDPAVITLTGRCYQREFVPYKAFDAVIDRLTSALRRLPTATVEAVLPRNVNDVVRLFPVLERVEAIRRAPRLKPPVELDDLRPRAFAALKELFARLADRHPLAIVVDDLHWGDVDSAELLSELLDGPDAPALLFVAGYRSEASDSSPLLTRLDERGAPHLTALRRSLELGPLDLESSIGLALDLLSSCDDDAWSLAKAIAREARGSPLFIAELSRHLATSTAAEARIHHRASLGVTLEAALSSRLDQLSTAEQQLLTVLAVAGAPLEQEVAARVAGLDQDPRLVIAELGRQRLVETQRRQNYDAAEVAHEPLREALLSRLGPRELRELHGRLAAELAATHRADPETLTRHYADAGRRRLAAEHALRSAARAQQSLAFDRAVHFYELALALGKPRGDERWQLLDTLGETLSRAGRIPAAVARTLEAARLAPAAAADRLTRRAAELELHHARVEGLFRGSPTGTASLFDGIARLELNTLLNESEVITGPPGALLVDVASQSDCLYVVLAGTVEVQQGERGTARIGEGAVLGEVPFLLGAPRTTRVFAGSADTRLLAINHQSLEALIEGSPRLALRLVFNLSRVVCAKAAGVHQRALGGGSATSQG